MRSELFPLCKFTDKVVNQAYEEARVALDSAGEKNQRLEIKKAADKRRDDVLARGPLLSAACTYLSLAQANITIENDDPERLYHFAANAFRDLDLLQRAAECYFNSALIGYRMYSSSGEGDSAFAQRSAGRAKAMFAELGDHDNSGESYLLQQRIRFTELKNAKKYPVAAVYWLWDLVSKFGTSPSRWLTSTLITIVLFAILYPMLIATCHLVASPEIQRTGISLITSSLAFSVGNLFQFGTLGTLIPISWLGQIVATAHGIVAFVLVGSGATFLTRN